MGKKIVSYKIKGEGWTKIYNTMFDYIEDPYAFKVYCYLCYCFNEQMNYSFPSYKTIANDCKMSKQKVINVIKYLEEKRLIEKIKTKTENNDYYNNCYKINYVVEINQDEIFLDSILAEELIEIEVEITKDERKNGNSYNRWREKVLKRDENSCQMCGCKENLHCHHIERYVDNVKLRYDVNNGIVLCEKCHYKTYGKEKEFEEYFKKIIKDKSNI